MCRHLALGGLLGVLVLAAQVGPARAYFPYTEACPTDADCQYVCTTNADCQYHNCFDVSCSGYESHPRCNNGVWDAICHSSGRCQGAGWKQDWWANNCPDPPAEWTTAEPTTTVTKPTTTPELTTTTPEPRRRPHCTSDADCGYEGCNDRSCSGYEASSRCNNGVWDVECFTGDCWAYQWYTITPEEWWYCPEPPAGWQPADPTTAGLTELQKCGDQCTFWLDTNKTMVKTGGPCTCSSLALANKGIAKIANGTTVDMPNLRSLNLRGNEIAELEPGWVRNVLKLEYLYLSGNKIAKLAKSTVIDMPNLYRLYLDNNEIAEFEPGWVRNVPKLEYLYLHNNPGAPFACSNVSSTFTTGCEMNRVANCGDECTFWVDGLRGWMLFKTGDTCECPNGIAGSTLNLDFMGIAKIDNGTVTDMPTLHSLYLSGNEIAELEPGWVSNVPDLRYLYLSDNKIIKLANGTVSDMPNLQFLHLDNNEIAELEPGWVSNVPNLRSLRIFDNPLGCVSGIADDVEIDTYSLENGFYETPRCPENCTINTYYDADNHVCLSCPENTYTDGIGAVNCTALAPASGCEPVEKIIYASWQEDPGRKDWGRPGHGHCVQPYAWDELVDGYQGRHIPYKVGGLGKRLEPGGYQTWVCLLDDHPCGDPHYCWVYHETDKVFTPWGTNTELGLLLNLQHVPTDAHSGSGSTSS